MRKVFAVVVLLAALVLAAFAGRSVWAGEPETVVVDKVPIPGPTIDPIIDDDQQQESSERPAGPAEHQDAKDETPPGVSEDDVEQIETSDPAGIGPPRPLGGAQLLSCTTHLVQNFSTRATGSKVSMPVVHYTVSSPGTLDAIRNLFNTPSFGASSHDLLEPSGRCVHIVPYDKKAWTQGAFNSVADSVEIICCTSDPSRSWWRAQPIIAKSLLASWIVDRLRARGLPPKLVNPEGCTPLAGYTDHRRLECGNTHTDVGANFPWDIVGEQVRTLYQTASTVLVWRAVAGAVLVQRPRYRAVIGWLRDHPRRVARAEREHGAVRLVRVRVAA